MTLRAPIAEGSGRSLAAIDLTSFDSKPSVHLAQRDAATHLRALLKQQTDDAHRALEATALMRAVSASVPDVDIYAAYLLAQWQLHVGLEAQLRQRFLAPWAQSRFLKSSWLQADLAALQRAPRHAPAAALVIQCDAQAWGVMYVLEGATLGLGVVTRRLPQAHPARCGAGRFMAAYGAQTGSRWAEFLHALATVDRADWPIVCDAARATFGQFQHVFGAVAA